MSSPIPAAALDAARDLLALAEGNAAPFPGAAQLATDCAALIEAAAHPALDAEAAHMFRRCAALGAANLAADIIAEMINAAHPAAESAGPSLVAGMLLAGAAAVIGGRPAPQAGVN
jgi:hypothetical protein